MGALLCCNARRPPLPPPTLSLADDEQHAAEVPSMYAVSRGPTPSPSPPPPPPPTKIRKKYRPPTLLPRRGNNINDSGDNTIVTTCAVCFDARVNIALDPCGHVVICTDCAHAVISTPATARAKRMRCPICRRYVRKALRLIPAGMYDDDDGDDDGLNSNQ